MAAARPFWTGIPRARRSGARLRGCMGCPGRRPGNNQHASWLPAVTMFVRLQARLSNKSAKSAGTVAAGATSREQLTVPCVDIGLGAVGELPAPFGQPHQEASSLVDLLPRLVGGSGTERTVLGPGA